MIKTISLPAEVYSVKAVQRAAYDLGDVVQASIESCKNGPIEVSFKVTSGDDCQNDEFISRFKQSALDHQVRIDTETEFKTIRQILVAQAFFPCSNLEELIEANKE